MVTGRVEESNFQARAPGGERRGASVAIVGAVAFFAYFLISRYLLVAADTVVTLRNNVLFETDSGVRLRYLTDPGTWAATRLEFLQHPAFFLVWRPVGLGLTSVLRPLAGATGGAVLAAQILICAMAAIGVGALFTISRRGHAGRAATFIPLVLMILSTATVLVVVPEHWAMAQGMMLVACALLILPGKPGPGRLAGLGLLCLLIAGTTITNAVFGFLLLFPLASAAGFRMRIGRLAPWLIAAAIATLLAAGWGLARLPHVAGFLNLRLYESPLRALSYMAFGLIGPIVGPVPHQGLQRGHLTLSYEPFSFSLYSPVQWIGVVAWIVLLLGCTRFAFRREDTRPVAVFLTAWIAFNLVFHNLWGDEFFLYSAHWAWALIVLIALGLRGLRPRLALPLTLAVIAGQIATLLTIGRMLRGS
jgi:hypothetical protein